MLHFKLSFCFVYANNEMRKNLQHLQHDNEISFADNNIQWSEVIRLWNILHEI